MKSMQAKVIQTSRTPSSLVREWLRLSSSATDLSTSVILPSSPNIVVRPERLGLGAELLPTSGSNETSCQRPFELVRKNTLRAKCFKDEDGRGMNELEKRRALEEASMTDESNDESCSKTNTVQSAKSRRQKLEARFVKQRLNRKRSRRKRVNVFTATETVKTGNLQCVEALEGPVRDEDLLEEVCTFVESGQTSTTAKRSGSNGKLLKGNSLSADEDTNIGKLSGKHSIKKKKKVA